MNDVSDITASRIDADSATEDILRNDLLANLRRWARRRSPNNVARELGISMARVRNLRSGGFLDLSTQELLELSARAALKAE